MFVVTLRILPWGSELVVPHTILAAPPIFRRLRRNICFPAGAHPSKHVREPIPGRGRERARGLPSSHGGAKSLSGGMAQVKPSPFIPALRSQGAWSECRALPGVVDCPPSRPEAKGERTRRPTSSSPVTVFDREMCRNPLLTKTLCDLTGVESDLDFPGQLAIEHLVWPAEITQTLQQAIGHIFQAAEQLHCRALPSLLSQLTQQAALLH